MDPAYYVAAGSLKARSFALDVVSNNLANVSTHGYKADRSFFSVFNKAKGSGVPKQVNDGTVIGQRGVNLDQSTLLPTSRPLDVALEGPGFLVVQTPQGPRLTRDGHLKLGNGGQLQALDGAPILGKTGQPLAVDPNGGPATIREDGSVQQGANVVGQLDIQEAADPAALRKVGHVRFEASGTQTRPANAKTVVRQGFLEQSGVDMPSAMVEMIRINRLFEMSMKVASTVSNDLDARSINDIAGLR